MLIVVVVEEEVVEVVVVVLFVVVVVMVVVSLLLFQTTKNGSSELLQIATIKEQKTNNISSLLSQCVDTAKALAIPMRNIESTSHYGRDENINCKNICFISVG